MIMGNFDNDHVESKIDGKKIQDFSVTQNYNPIFLHLIDKPQLIGLSKFCLFCMR